MREIDRSHILTGLLFIAFALFASYYSKDFSNACSFHVNSSILALTGLLLIVPAIISAAYRKVRKKERV